MYSRAAKWLVIALAISATASAGGKPETWIEVRTPHFLVATDGNEKQGRRVADDFERIREVFEKGFPGIKVDPPAPILIIAAKNRKTFESLAPKEWLQKGALRHSGFFLRGPEKNYVFLRLDSGSDQLHHLLYHEYTHLVIDQFPGAVPVWLNEGLAEYYGNSIIGDKSVSLGRPDVNHLSLLRQTKLMPLEILFTVDRKSPYYNENDKGSIFYAESWALTHMLMTRSFDQRRSLISEYLNLLQHNVDTRTAAKRAFGDIQTLQKDLLDYLGLPGYRTLQMKTDIESDRKAYLVQELTAAQSDALLGDFLIYNHRFDEARALLKRAMEEDPKSADASESMGYLEYLQNNPEEAKKWFTQAVHLNSHSYFAHYYSAIMLIREAPGNEPPEEAGENLRKAIEINPNFAPAYGALAAFYANQGTDLEAASRALKKAIELAPNNFYNRLTQVQILLRQQHPKEALEAAKHAAAMAHDMDELSAAQNMLANAQRYAEFLESMKHAGEVVQTANGKSAGGGETPPKLRHRGEPVYTIRTKEENPIKFQSDPARRGKRDTLTGTIKEVKCSLPAVMEMTFTAGKQTVELFSENYFKVAYSALNFTPSGAMRPCEDLKGMQAQIYFYDLKDKPNQGELISVQLKK